MEKSCHPTLTDNTTNTSTASTTTTTTTTSTHTHTALKSLNKASYKISKPTISTPPPPPPPTTTTQQPQPQPPVYNIDRNDFRDVVQKLTGSPAHHHPLPAPPAPRPPISRLHRIRPPPLAPPRAATPAPPAPPPPAGEGWLRPPLSPLPPFPAVISAAAESPITAYLRRLHDGSAGPQSPLAFGSPQTAYQMMLSQSLLFPTSPRLPLPSPK